jgi:putative ABC transport system permease protein
MLSNLLFDLKYAMRLFTKSLGHSFLCIVVVALSVGLSLFVFVIDYNMFLKPLPFAGSDKWLSVQIAEKESDPYRPNVDAFTYQQILERDRTVDHVGAFSRQPVVLSEGEASVRLRAAAITPGLFTATGVKPLLGRVFGLTDAEPGAARTIVLSHTAWQTYFAADPDVVGKQTTVDGEPVRVIGVLPEEFFAFRDFEIWLPLQHPKLARPADSEAVISPIVIPKQGQSKEDVQRSLQAIVDEVARIDRSRYGSERGISLFPANRMYTHGNIAVVAMATIIAAAVLLLGAINISLMIFTMLLERSKELALRTALGSTRMRLIRQCLLQSALFVVLGLVLGCGLAIMAVDWAHGLLDFTARLQAAGRDPNELVLRPTDLLIAGAIAVVLWLASTLFPAFRLSSLDPAKSLAGSGKGGIASRGRSKIASILVGLQVFVSSVLLVVCGNVVLAVNSELSKPIGIEEGSRMISTFPTEFDSRYSEPSGKIEYWDRLTAAIRQRVPGAEVAIATSTPTAPESVAAILGDRADDSQGGTMTIPVTTVSENYFDILGVKLVRGRTFAMTDDATSINVALVDTRAAEAYWPGGNPIGQRIRLNPNENGPWLEIIGVVSHVSGPYPTTPGLVYRPLRQVMPEAFQVIVKLPTGMQSAREEIQAAAFSADPDLPLHNLQMLDEYLVALNSFKSLVPGFTGIGLVLLVLAATGLFGLIGRNVAQRTHEIGILRALGSSNKLIVLKLLKQGLVYLSVALVGGCIGIVMTTGMSATISNVLDGIVVVTTAIFVLIGAIIFVSAFVPARKAVTMEPSDALRYE